MRAFAIVPAGPLLPEGVVPLAAEADREGIRNVATLVERWVDGIERYEGPGESALAAVADGEVIAVGALSRCPDVAGALRVRRFYVTPPWRRQGVARALAEELVSLGLGHAEVLTCNARASAASPPFWERMGFEPVDIAGITHVLRR